MAQCPRCGGPMPTFSLGRMKQMCPACEKQTAPYRQQYATLHREDAASEGMVTKGLLALNVFVFIMMVVSGVSPIEPSGADIFKWGAEFGPYTLGAQPWRLFACMFIHIGILHLAFNMWCLWDLGKMAEKIFGSGSFLVLYLASGICGSYLSLLWNPLRSSAGASGAIFGIAGALIAAFKLGNLQFDSARVKMALRSVVLFAIYNLMFGFAIPGINNMAHLGGLIGGLVIGFLFTRFFPPHSQRYRMGVGVLTPVLVVALVGGYFGLRQLKASQLALGQGAIAAEGGDCVTAIPKLERAVATDPKDPDAHIELGFCYEKANRPDDAAREYEQSLALGGNDPYAHQELGWMAIRKNDYAGAEKHFRAALQQDPKDGELNRGLALSLLRAGKSDEARKYAEQAVATEPNEPANQEVLGMAYRDAGRALDALKAFQKAVSLAPNDPDLHRELADAYEKSGDTKSAADERQRAAQLQSRSK